MRQAAAPTIVVARPTGEMKFFDTVMSSAPIDTTGENIQALNLIPQGVTESTRVGRKCTIKRITMKGFLRWDPAMNAASYGTSHIRLALVLDKQANGAAPDYTDVYETNSVLSPRNLANVGRFKVLKCWQLNPAEGQFISTAVACPLTPIEFNKKVDIPLEFNSTTGAITEIRSNNLVLMAISNVGDDVHLLSAYWRVSFTDM